MASDQMGEPHLQPVVFECMPQQPGLLGTEDDWTGVTSSAGRRRLQNRLNQRAYRKRKRNELKQAHGETANLSVDPLPERASPAVLANNPENLNADITLHGQATEIWELFYSAIWIGSVDRQKLCRVATNMSVGSISPKQIVSQFEKWVERFQMIGSPRTDTVLVLVKFNVFRALISNARDLGISDQVCTSDDAVSLYYDPCQPSRFMMPAPPTLQPTTLQRQIHHHPWIDALPISGMRDNLLLAGDSYDEGKLCMDLVGLHGESIDRDGMIVWGDPWDPASWEVTSSFANYWGWTIRGCEQLFQSTNYWREQRGEKPLRFERLLCDGVRQLD